jgi:Zn-dependent protease
MLNQDPATLIARVLVLLVAFTMHELAHALTADYLGDPTPRRMGRISLNPLVHLDVMGTIMLIFSGFGWAKPVMVNPFNMRGDPRRSMAIVAIAGPLTNILLAVIFALPFRFGLVELEFTTSGVLPSLDFIMLQFVWINLILAFFNIIPIPPLDGSRILFAVLPAEMAYQLRPLEQYGFLILFALIFLVPNFGQVFIYPASTVLNWLI